MPYDKPNYTQAPNAFFDDHLPAIKSLAELKVTLIVLRNTIGWHKESVDLTLKELMTRTGMSRPSVVEGTDLALKRETITRVKKGRSFTYEANILSVKNLYLSGTEMSKESLPTSVKNLYRSPDVSLLEKERKESKNTTQALRAAVISDTKRLFGFLQSHIGPRKDQKGQGAAIKWLLGNKYTVDQCESCWKYLAAQEWRTTAVTWMTVVKEIGSWLAKQQPSTVGDSVFGDNDMFRGKDE